SGPDLKSVAEKESESAINELKLALTASQKEPINFLSIKNEFKNLLTDKIMFFCKEKYQGAPEESKWKQAQSDYDALKLRSVKIIRKYSDILEMRQDEISSSNKKNTINFAVNEAFAELLESSKVGVTHA
ncbi:MAG: hypothetical protein KDD45_16455, partial [Bdellovibrionales bacterium]|nr:hypothetical protein [Bdellovibrionales bacterium]